MVKPEELHRFWQLDPMRQSFIRAMCPYITDIVYALIIDQEYVILGGHWNGKLIEELSYWLEEDYTISDDQIEDALWELNDRGLIEYDGYEISKIHSYCRRYRAC